VTPHRRKAPRRRPGVLLDVDGTLVDSAYLHTVCWWEAFRQHARHVAMPVVGRSIGMGSDVLIEHILGETPDDAEEISTAHSVLYRTYWDRLRPLPGARELVTACAERGLIVVLASSAKDSDLVQMRQVLDCDEHITAATSSADVAASKPNPDLVGAALGSAGLRAADSVFVGDAVWDVEAARRAHVACIGVASGVFSQPELADAGAVATYADAHDLVAHLADSPIGGLVG
jgi:HAD superfamily hydrolase (TIGR01509 family)